MARVFFVLVVIVFLGQATGVLPFVAEIECDQTCPDERLNGQCAPLCMCYTCGAHHRPLTPVERIALSKQQCRQYVPLQPLHAPASPVPGKIFHVLFHTRGNL
jgi:hypothetical protein